MDCLYEWRLTVSSSQSLEETVAADRVRFVNVRLDGAYGSGNRIVEDPVVQRKQRVRGKAGNYTRSVERHGLFEAALSATVDCGVNFVRKPLSHLDYATFDTAKIKVGRLSVEDG